MPSLRARSEETEMELSVPGTSPWIPAAQACVSDAPAVTHAGSALCDPHCCGYTEPGTTPPHHQQPGTGNKFLAGCPHSGGTLSMSPCSYPQEASMSSLGMGCPMGLRAKSRGQRGIWPGPMLSWCLSRTLCFPT